jgi:hypothetical protein
MQSDDLPMGGAVFVDLTPGGEVKDIRDVEILIDGEK